MKIYRFMSLSEFNRMQLYSPIVNNNHHRDMRSSSIGACFIASSDYKPEYALQFLTGLIPDDSICVEFEADNNDLTLSCGTYADPQTYDTMTINEYCTTHYSRDTFEPLRYGIIDMCSCSMRNCIEWYTFN